MELNHAYEARFCISILEMWTVDHGVYQMGWYQSSTLSMRIPNTSSFSCSCETSVCQVLLCHGTEICEKQVALWINLLTEVSKLTLQAVSDRHLFGLAPASLSTFLCEPENQDVRFFKTVAWMCIFTPLQTGTPALWDVKYSPRLPNPSTL